jgi:hypothetical protein
MAVARRDLRSMTGVIPSEHRRRTSSSRPGESGKRPPLEKGRFAAAGH